MVYHVEYDGYYTMSNHDKEENALKRWFDNYKVDKNAWFANEYECLIVETVDANARHIRKRQICKIEDEGRKTSREVVMDHTAPPAPMLTFAAKRRWEPPPPKTPAELRRETAYAIMYAQGYEPRILRKPVYNTATPSWKNPFLVVDGALTMQYTEEIEWVKRGHDYFPLEFMRDTPKFTPPPPPKHRRNA